MSYASRSLSETEKKYAQVEKEFLAITYACKKFHNYVYGRDIIVKSDHKPVIAIMEKDIHKISSSKLQRMRIRLLNYKLKVEYLPGKYMFIADYLSRDFIKSGDSEEDKVFSESVLSINVSNAKQEEFKENILRDTTLKLVLKYCMDGWPNDISKVPDHVRVYYKLKNDIFCENGLLFLNGRIIVPTEMTSHMLELLHDSHMGFYKTKKRANSIFFWPNMNRDVENKISKCQICAKYKNSCAKEPMIPHEIPNLAFNKIACDILDFGNKSFLVVIDYYSKWIEFTKIQNKSSSERIRNWMHIFASLGIPRTVIADNSLLIHLNADNSLIDGILK